MALEVAFCKFFFPLRFALSEPRPFSLSFNPHSSSRSWHPLAAPLAMQLPLPAIASVTWCTKTASSAPKKVLSTNLSCSSFILFMFGHDQFVRGCGRMCGETQTSRRNETCHDGVEQNWRVFIGSFGDEEHRELVNRVVVEDSQVRMVVRYDESGWSLNTSQMLLLGARFPACVGRSPRRRFPF